MIELLVVISIIGVLAGMLLPVLSKAKLKAQIAKARTEIKGIESAINQYHATYSHYPASQRVRKDGVSNFNPDFTFGTYGTTTPMQLPYTTRNSKTTTIPAQPVNGVATNNSEVIGILMNIEEWETRKKGNKENRQGQDFLNANFTQTRAGDGKPPSPGIGLDGVYRDPWGSPYIITLDLNYDGLCRDAFYRSDQVTETTENNRVVPINGLIKAARDSYEIKGGVAVWSLGPDRQADPLAKANDKSKANFDNILSWAQ